jgi:hypothetical protein
MVVPFEVGCLCFGSVRLAILVPLSLVHLGMSQKASVSSIDAHSFHDLPLDRSSGWATPHSLWLIRTLCIALMKLLLNNRRPRRRTNPGLPARRFLLPFTKRPRWMDYVEKDDGNESACGDLLARIARGELIRGHAF